MKNEKMFFEILKKHFKQAANSERAKEQQRYMKSSMPYFGVPIPEVRKIVDAISKPYLPETNDEYRVIIQYIFNQATHRVFCRLYMKKNFLCARQSVGLCGNIRTATPVLCNSLLRNIRTNSPHFRLERDLKQLKEKSY